MKRIILIIMLFMSISSFAKEGDIEISINGGISTGTGFGLSYNISDKLRIKLASVFIATFYDSSSTLGGYSIGGALSLDLKKLSDDISSVYLFIGTNHVGIINESTIPIHLYGLGLGLRKFIDENQIFRKLFV